MSAQLPSASWQATLIAPSVAQEALRHHCSSPELSCETGMTLLPRWSTAESWVHRRLRPRCTAVRRSRCLVGERHQRSCRRPRASIGLPQLRRQWRLPSARIKGLHQQLALVNTMRKRHAEAALDSGGYRRQAGLLCLASTDQFRRLEASRRRSKDKLPCLESLGCCRGRISASRLQTSGPPLGQGQHAGSPSQAAVGPAAALHGTAPQHWRRLRRSLATSLVRQCAQMQRHLDFLMRICVLA